jgi:1,4-alpha-glucan branching enzyme
MSPEQTQEEKAMKKSTVKTSPALKSSPNKSSAKKKLGKKVEFSYYAPQAKKVAVGGCFNNWNADKNPMTKDKNGDWSTELSLAPGRYEYRFYVDGDWQNDPHCVECVPNAFGSWNCVIQVS